MVSQVNQIAINHK